MQLRVSNMRAPYGRSFWSEPVQLDSLGGAAIVSVPCPGPKPVICPAGCPSSLRSVCHCQQGSRTLLRRSGQAQGYSPRLLVWHVHMQINMAQEVLVGLCMRSMTFN